jgi:hypothetical protein
LQVNIVRSEERLDCRHPYDEGPNQGMHLLKPKLASPNQQRLGNTEKLQVMDVSMRPILRDRLGPRFNEIFKYKRVRNTPGRQEIADPQPLQGERPRKKRKTVCHYLRKYTVVTKTRCQIEGVYLVFRLFCILGDGQETELCQERVDMSADFTIAN